MMRKAYRDYYKSALDGGMRRAWPEFQPLDQAGRRRAGGIRFYGPGQLDAYAWSPISPLVFVAVFRVIESSDEFEAAFEWADDGKLDNTQPYLLENLFSDSTFSRSHARTLLQALSMAVGDGERRVFSWPFWEPSVSRDKKDEWFKEFIADETRALTSDEARNRVNTAITKAMNDIARCARPWFDRKLQAYAAKVGA